MRINRIKKYKAKILLATILCVIAFSATSRANNTEFSLREIFSKSQSEPGEAYYFFIPQKADDKNQNTYIYDTKYDRLLFFPKHKDLISKIEGQEIDPEDWSVLLNKIILNVDHDARQAQSEDSTQLKVIELDENWVKFTLSVFFRPTGRTRSNVIFTLMQFLAQGRINKRWPNPDTANINWEPR